MRRIELEQVLSYILYTFLRISVIYTFLRISVIGQEVFLNVKT